MPDNQPMWTKDDGSNVCSITACCGRSGSRHNGIVRIERNKTSLPHQGLENVHIWLEASHLVKLSELAKLVPKIALLAGASEVTHPNLRSRHVSHVISDGLLRITIGFGEARV